MGPRTINEFINCSFYKVQHNIPSNYKRFYHKTHLFFMLERIKDLKNVQSENHAVSLAQQLNSNLFTTHYHSIHFMAIYLEICVM